MAESKGKILIADDMETFLRLEKMLLERSGYEIVMAKSGPEAIKKIQAEKPILVFLDMLMPEMNGDVVCRFVKTNKALKHIPVIMVTTKSEPEYRERCAQAGCDDFITKPVTQRDLFERIQKFVTVERREYDRALLKVTVSATGQSYSFSEFTYDVSEGGVFVETDHVLEAGEKVALEFSLPDEPAPVKAEGKCAHWVSSSKVPEGRRAGVGFQFTDISDGDILRIRKYVLRNNR